MKGKTFFIASIITVALVAAVTSLIVINLLKTQILAAPAQEGDITIQGGIGSDLNVIIIDTSEVSGISDVITFTGVTGGNTYNTQIPTGGYAGPKPFVIRNKGNVKANVDVYSMQTKLFSDIDSHLKFWIEPIYNGIIPMGLDAPYDVLDNCQTTSCYASTACTSASPCEMPYDVDGPGPMTEPGDLPIRAINALEFEDTRDEAFMQIKIIVAQDEPAGSKSTKVVITSTAV